MEENRGDIERFVESQVDCLISKKLLLDGNVNSKLKSKIIETLKNGTQGMFRWVEMSLEALKRIEFLPDFKEALGQLPSDLSGLYDIIHAQIDQSKTYGRDIATQTLKWLLCAQRLLSAKELIAAVYKFDDDMSSLQSPENDILRLCRNLVVFDCEKRLFRFAHQSVREYLLNKSQYAAVEQHTLATERCLNVYLTEWMEGSQFSNMQQQNEILKPYAEIYWPVHYKHVEDSKYIEFIQEEFCSTGRIHGRSLPYVQWLLDILKPYREVHRTVRYKDAERSTSNNLEINVLRFTERIQGRSLPYDQWISDVRSRCGNNAGWKLNMSLGLDLDDRLGYKIQFVASRPDPLLATASAFGIPSFLQGCKSLEHNSHPLLVSAVKEGHDQVAQILVDVGADVNAQVKSDENALGAACRRGNGHVIQLLLDKGADVNALDGHALRQACDGGHGHIVQLLLDKGANVDAQGDHESALQAASREGHEQTVQILLDRGANINLQGRKYGTALQAASDKGYEQVIQILLDRGADVNLQGGYYGTALQAASYEGYKQVVQMLLDRGANVNLQGGRYTTALGAALYKDHIEIIQMLLARGAKI